jgi:hypothetical protein
MWRNRWWRLAAEGERSACCSRGRKSRGCDPANWKLGARVDVVRPGQDWSLATEKFCPNLKRSSGYPVLDGQNFVTLARPGRSPASHGQATPRFRFASIGRYPSLSWAFGLRLTSSRTIQALSKPSLAANASDARGYRFRRQVCHKNLLVLFGLMLVVACLWPDPFF